MIKRSDFKPAWWLRNPHLQTMWGALLRRHRDMALYRERVELPDGDFLDLDWINHQNNDEQAPMVLVLHGLGGSIDSHYAKAIMNAIAEQGWQGIFMHYRGCSGEPNRKAFSYHSGYTGDLAFVASQIQQRFPERSFAAVGYSLGGSVLLNWLGETGTHNPLHTAIAISVPFELNKAADRMLNGFSRLYQWHILRCLRYNIRSKFEILDTPFDITHIDTLKTFWEFDTHVTAPIHGFKDATDYYQRASSRKLLKRIATPTLILHSADDPFMSPDSIPQDHELSHAITLELTQGGGHVGFITGTVPGLPKYWLEQRIIKHLQQTFFKHE